MRVKPSASVLLVILRLVPPIHILEHSTQKKNTHAQIGRPRYRINRMRCQIIPCLSNPCTTKNDIASCPFRWLSCIDSANAQDQPTPRIDRSWADPLGCWNSRPISSFELIGWCGRRTIRRDHIRCRISCIHQSQHLMRMVRYVMGWGLDESWSSPVFRRSAVRHAVPPIPCTVAVMIAINLF